MEVLRKAWPFSLGLNLEIGMCRVNCDNNSGRFLNEHGSFVPYGSCFKI